VETAVRADERYIRCKDIAHPEVNHCDISHGQPPSADARNQDGDDRQKR
jgi:hypothetical protein